MIRDDMTPIQAAFWVGLTDQRVANIWAMADMIGDMSMESREFLRSAKPETLAFLKDIELKPDVKEFLRAGKAETFTFLKDLRPDEIGELSNAIENARSFRKAGRLMRWTLGTVFAAITAGLFLYDRYAQWSGWKK